METEPTDDGDGEQVKKYPDDFYCEGINVLSRGTVTIPSRHRERYDIAHRDVVDMIVHTSGGSFPVTDAPVINDGRVRIPERKRRLYGIETGDRVDIEVATTTMTMPPADGGES